MPAPTNISALTATDLGAFPSDVDQTVDDAGTTYTVWYKFTASQTGVISVWAHGQYGATSYEPTCAVFEGPAAAPVAYLAMSAVNEPMYFPVTSGTEYFLRITSNSGNPTPADLTVEAENFSATSPVPIGSIAVNDDDSDTGFTVGLAVMSATTNYDVLYYRVGSFAPGEQGDVLPSGIALVGVGGSAAGAILYDDEYAEIDTPLLGETLGTITCNATDLFYVNDTDGGGNIVKTVGPTGTIGGDTWDLGASAIKGMAVSHDDTILYYRNSASSAIRRWDLVNDVALSDLVDPGISIGSQFVDMLCLASGNVVYGYTSGGTDTAKVYSAAGALLQTITLFSPGGGSSTRLCRGVDDDTTFWAWKKNSNPSVFKEFLVADGSTVTTRNHGLYARGVYSGSVPSSGLITSRFGSSDSCPMWITRTEFTPEPPEETGTIIVVKRVCPNTDTSEFDFEAGGMTPTTFTLGHNDQQLFAGLTPGDGFSVEETTVNPDFLPPIYSVSNGSPVDNITVAADEVVTVTVTNHRVIVPEFEIEEDPRVWERTAPIISSENRRVFYNMFFLDCQVGTGQASGAPENVDPQVMMQYSDDSGLTWSNELWRPMGRIGKYLTRLVWNRLGVARNRVFRVRGSAAVKTMLLDGGCDVDPSTDAPKS